MYCLYFFNLSLTWKTRMQHKWQNQACPWWPCVLPTEALSDEQNIRWSLKQAENIEGQVVLLCAYVLYNIPDLIVTQKKEWVVLFFDRNEPESNVQMPLQSLSSKKKNIWQR